MHSFPNLKPARCFMSISNHFFWPAYRFLRRQIRWSGIPISLRIFQFVLIHTVKGFSVSMKQKEMSFWNSLASSMIQQMLAISSSPVISKPSLYIWKFSVHVLLKPSLTDFEHYLASMWSECNCTIIWTFFGTALLWDWNENWPFPLQGPLLGFQFAGILNAALSQHHLSGFEIAQLEFRHLH